MTELTTDERDFYEMMRGEDKMLGRYVLAKLNAGLDPRDIATLLEYEANQARGWCNGRFGVFVPGVAA